MGMFAFRRLRDQEAAREAASFSIEQSQQQEPPVEPVKRRGRQPKTLPVDSD